MLFSNLWYSCKTLETVFIVYLCALLPGDLNHYVLSFDAIRAALIATNAASMISDIMHISLHVRYIKYILLLFRKPNVITVNKRLQH